MSECPKCMPPEKELIGAIAQCLKKEFEGWISEARLSDTIFKMAAEEVCSVIRKEVHECPELLNQFRSHWRPIETADTLPKDGNYFLVIDMLNHGKPLVIFWHGSDFIECENGSSIEIESYTHWSPVAPLPPPPTRPGEEV